MWGAPAMLSFGWIAGTARSPTCKSMGTRPISPRLSSPTRPPTPRSPPPGCPGPTRTDPSDLTAVVISHAHADHCVDIYGLHVLNKYGLERTGLPVYAPEGVERVLEGLVGEWSDTFDWKLVGDGDRATIADAQLRFSRTD